MSDVLARAAHRWEAARQILSELQLPGRWAPYGEPVLVGAAAYGLMVSPDIDFEIYCPQVRVEDGFRVLEACARHPRVTHARFGNHLNGPDMGLYWQLRYKAEDGTAWKLDMWSMAQDHPGPTSRALVAPMQRALTPETREAILLIKEAVAGESIGSIWVYRAVLSEGIRTPEAFRTWYEREAPNGLTFWQP